MDGHIDLKFTASFDSTDAEVSVKFQRDGTILNTNFVTKYFEGSYDKMSYQILKRPHDLRVNSLRPGEEFMVNWVFPGSGNDLLPA